VGCAHGYALLAPAGLRPDGTGRIVGGLIGVRFRYSPMQAISSVLCLLSLMSSQQTADRIEKQKALHEPVCLIPMDRQIEVGDLPRAVHRLDWMRRLKPSLPISLVSIPATHDAGTALGRTGQTRCQVLSIPAQLAVGVRGFDIRLRLIGSDLHIYHSEESQKLEFKSVMKAIGDFLHSHPSEFIVMRVKEEWKAMNPSESFEAAFEKTIEPYRSHFYHPSSRTEIPLVAQMRGKILILDNYGKLPDAVDYPNSAMNIQDDYDTSDMAKKFGEIVAQFELARKQTDGRTWVINYTSSCTLAVDQLANARAVNAKFQAHLKGFRGNLGLVLMNFPSVDAVEHILESNF